MSFLSAYSQNNGPQSRQDIRYTNSLASLLTPGSISFGPVAAPARAAVASAPSSTQVTKQHSSPSPSVKITYFQESSISRGVVSAADERVEARTTCFSASKDPTQDELYRSLLQRLSKGDVLDSQRLLQELVDERYYDLAFEQGQQIMKRIIALKDKNLFDIVLQRAKSVKESKVPNAQQQLKNNSKQTLLESLEMELYMAFNLMELGIVGTTEGVKHMLELVSQNKELLKQNLKQQQDNDKLVEMGRKLQEQHENLQRQHSNLQQQHDQRGKDLSKLQKAHEELQQQHTKLSQDHDDLSKKHADLMAARDKLDQNLKKLMEESAAAIRRLQADKEQLTQEKSRQSQAIKDLQDELQKTTIEKEDLKKEMQQQQDESSKQIQSLTDKVISTEQQLQETRDLLAQKDQQFEQAIAAANTEIEQLKQKNGQLEQDKKDLVEKEEEQARELLQLQESNKKLAEENAIRSQAIKDLQDQSMMLTKEKQQLQEQVDELVQLQQETTKTVDEFKAQQRLLLQALADPSSAVVPQQQDDVSLETKIKEILSERAKLRDEKAQLREQLEQLQAKHDQEMQAIQEQHQRDQTATAEQIKQLQQQSEFFQNACKQLSATAQDSTNTLQAQPVRPEGKRRRRRFYRWKDKPVEQEPATPKDNNNAQPIDNSSGEQAVAEPNSAKGTRTRQRNGFWKKRKAPVGNNNEQKQSNEV